MTMISISILRHDLINSAGNKETDMKLYNDMEIL